MDGVLIDSEAAYAEELIEVFGSRGLDITKAEIFGLVGSSQKTFTTSLARWFERNGLGSFTPEDAVALFNRWTEGTVYDYAGMLNPGVAETLGVSSSQVHENDGTHSTEYDVVVILGSDLG